MVIFKDRQTLLVKYVVGTLTNIAMYYETIKKCIYYFIDMQ